ncbi:MAG: hypothetical protein ACXWL2_00960 [Candidatus Chromulinivorax sp.]
MNFWYKIILVINLTCLLHADAYVDSLNRIISDTISNFGKYSTEINQIIKPVNLSTKKSYSLHEINSFLDKDRSVIISFADQLPKKLDQFITKKRSKFSTDLCPELEVKILQDALAAKLYVYYLDCLEQKLLDKAVKNYNALQYWQNEKFQEGKSFFNKSILRWFSWASYQKTIDSNIKEISDLSEKIYYFLGLTRQNKINALQAKSREEFEQAFIVGLQLQNNFLHLSDYNFDQDNFAFFLKNAIDEVYQFNIHLSTKYAYCQLPSHFQRHTQEYILSAVLVSVAAYVSMQYGADIKNGVEHFYAAHIQGPLQRNLEFLGGYAKPPQLPIEQDAIAKQKQQLKTLVEIAVQKEAAKTDRAITRPVALANFLDEITAGDFSENRKDFEEVKADVKRGMKMVKPHLDNLDKISEKHPNMLWIDLWKYFQGWRSPVFPHKFQKGSRTLIKDAFSWVTFKDQTERDDQLIDDESQDKFSNHVHIKTDYEISLPKETLNLMNYLSERAKWKFDQKKEYAEKQFQIIQAFPYENPSRAHEPYVYEVAKMQLEVLEGKKLANKFAEDLFVILGIGTLLPAITVAGGSLFASKKIYDSVIYKPIKKFIHELEVILNECLYEKTLFDKEGYIYFLTEQLRLHEHVLTQDEQKLLQKDLAALQDCKLDYTQRFNVIQRMYRTYPCLASIGS